MIFIQLVGVLFSRQCSRIENTQLFGWKSYACTIANHERPYIICNCYWLKPYIEFSLKNRRHRLVERLCLRTCSWLQSTYLVKTQTHGCGRASFFSRKETGSCVYLFLTVGEYFVGCAAYLFKQRDNTFWAAIEILNIE